MLSCMSKYSFTRTSKYNDFESSCLNAIIPIQLIRYKIHEDYKYICTQTNKN